MKEQDAQAKLSLKLQAYQYLKTKILNCEYRPNEFLNEQKLCAEMGNISRTPMRDALGRLEQEGLITILPKKGLMVSGITEEDVHSMFEMRLLVEPYALRTYGNAIPREQLEAYAELMHHSERIEDFCESDDLFQIFQAQVLPLTDLLQADGCARRIARQLRHQAQGVAALGGKFHGSPLLVAVYSIARYSDFAKEKPLVQTKKVCYHRMEQNLSLRSESMTEKITAADAIRLLDTGKAVAVDVREPDEYAVGHIPGAKLLPLGQVIDRAAEVLPDKNALWLVYCRTGRRSADAVQKLEALGYTHLRDLGGILSWPYEIEGDFEGHF